MQKRSDRFSANNKGNAFAERAKASRLRAGLTQQQLSDRLHREANVSLDTSAITRIEAGQREPRLGEALALAKVLEFGLDDLAPQSDLDSYLSDVHQLMEESRAALVKMVRSADPVVDFVRRNPDCLGDDCVEDLFSRIIERFQQHTPPQDFESADLQAGNFAITTNRKDERLKRQLLRAVSDAILVRADELQPAYDRWFNDEDQRTRRKPPPTSKAVHGRQSAHSRTNAGQ